MEKLKKYLIEHGIKQSFVADKIGVSNRQMSYLINEATTIKLELLQKITVVLNCRVEDIVNDEKK